MKTKHTPGPWKIRRNQFEGRLACIGFVADEFTVGTSRPFLCQILSVDHPQTEANARLIENAPTILEALQLMMTFEGLIAEHRPAAVHTIEMAKDAIAKATGEPFRSAVTIATGQTQ